MTVRVWMKPSELGEAGYFIDAEPAVDYSTWTIKGERYLVLLSEIDGGLTSEVGRVAAGRWDMALILPDPPAKATPRRPAPKRKS